MALRSMTGFAQVKAQVTPALAFSLMLKSVNHRFLDLHFRMPSDTDALEMKLRRLLKEELGRGHVEVTLSLEHIGGNGVALNREMVNSYVQAFRTASAEFGVGGEPDLNVVLRMPGAMDSSAEKVGEDLEAAVMANVEEALAKLNQMREEEGRGTAAELRERMAHLLKLAQAWKDIATRSCAVTPNDCSRECRRCWARKLTKSEYSRKPRCLLTAAISRKSWSACRLTSNIFSACLIRAARSGKNWTFSSRK